jgi:hypothetical protein
LTSGALDGDRLPALSATKKGGVPATGAPSGLFLKDDGTWAAVGGVDASSLSHDGTTRKPSADMDWNTKKLTNCPEIDAPTSTALTLKPANGYRVIVSDAATTPYGKIQLGSNDIYRYWSSQDEINNGNVNGWTISSYAGNNLLTASQNILYWWSSTNSPQIQVWANIASKDASLKLQTYGSTSGLLSTYRDTTQSGSKINYSTRLHSDTLGTGGLILSAAATSAPIKFFTTEVERMKIDSAGIDTKTNPIINVQSIKNVATVTTLTGTAGTVPCCQPDQGASYKKVHVYLDGYTDNATPANNVYTFPVAFAKAPYLYGDAAAVAVCVVTTTTLTISGAVTITGNVFVEGH